MRSFLTLAVTLTLLACGAAPKAAMPTVGVPSSSGDAPNAHLLTSVEALADKVTAGGETGAADLVIVDARPAADYAAGHLPGAVNAPWSDLADDAGVPRPDGVIADVLGLLGASRDVAMVLYDAGPADPSAERLFWLLEHLGATELQILAGGLARWNAASLPTTATLPRRPPASFVVSRRPQLAADDDRLQAALAGGAVLVDARDDAEYMGWPLGGLPRGGHLAGAIHFPASWTRDDDGPRAHGQLGPLARAKLPTDRPLVLYSTAAGRASQLYFALRLADFQQLAVYPGGLARWTADPKRAKALEALERHAMFVHPGWLSAVQAGESPPHPPRGSKTLVIEVSWGEAKNVYDKGHIPGAIHLNTDHLEADDAIEPRNWWNLRPDAELEKNLLALGVTRDSTVVVYSHTHLAAARAAWALMVAGVSDVRLLNGGWTAWTRAGLPTSTEPTAPTPAANFGGPFPGNPDLRKSTSQVRGALEGGFPVVAIRSWDEHVGKTSGYKYIEPKGRIKGSIWGRGGPDANSVADFEDDDGTLRSYTEVAALWRTAGIADDKLTIFYCGTGWRASVAFLYAHAMGRRTALYDGGWMEWSMGPKRKSNPIETGVPNHRND